MTKATYFKIMQAASAVIMHSELDDADPLSRNILDFIGMQQSVKRDLRVKDIIARYVLSATPPTIYARLSELEENGWIYFRNDPTDGRAKLARLTDRAVAFYARIDRAIAKAAT